jgi:hypothetical protein
MKRALLVTAVFVGCGHAETAVRSDMAQKASSSASTVVRPTPDQAKTVEAFSGTWAYDAVLQLPNEKPVTTTVGMICDPILAKKALACTMNEVFPGLGLYQGVFLIGHDPLDQKVHLFAVAFMAFSLADTRGALTTRANARLSARRDASLERGRRTSARSLAMHSIG